MSVDGGLRHRPAQTWLATSPYGAYEGTPARNVPTSRKDESVDQAAALGQEANVARLGWATRVGSGAGRG